jgi:hypothetical protein
MGSEQKDVGRNLGNAARPYDAVRYGIGLQLKDEMLPQEHLPQHFRDLVSALECAEQARKDHRG